MLVDLHEKVWSFTESTRPFYSKLWAIFNVFQPYWSGGNKLFDHVQFEIFQVV